MLLSEFKVLGETDHPNIVRVYQLLEDNKFYYVIMELMSGGDLMDSISRRQKLSDKIAKIKGKFGE